MLRLHRFWSANRTCAGSKCSWCSFSLTSVVECVARHSCLLTFLRCLQRCPFPWPPCPPCNTVSHLPFFFFFFIRLFPLSLSLSLSLSLCVCVWLFLFLVFDERTTFGGALRGGALGVRLLLCRRCRLPARLFVALCLLLPPCLWCSSVLCSCFGPSIFFFSYPHLLTASCSLRSCTLIRLRLWSGTQRAFRRFARQSAFC